MRSSFFWSFASNYLGIAIQLASTMLLARLMSPSEIGAYAIAGALFAIGQMFRNMGVSTYLIREPNLTRYQIEAALFIVCCTCLMIAFTLFAISGLVASFYSNPILSPVLKVLALNMLFIPFGTFAQSQMRKSMQFKALGMIEVSSQIVHFIVAVMLALNEFGAMSLAIASLGATLTTIILVNQFRATKEKYSPHMEGVLRILPSVMTIGASNIVQSLNGQSHPIILGKTMSESAVAIYDKGLSVITLLNEAIFKAIQNVLTPYFATMRGNANLLENSYLNIVSHITAIVWPLLFCLSFYSEFVVLFLFGEQWIESIKLIPFLCLSASISTIDRYFNEFLLNSGLENIVLKINTLVLTLKVAVLATLSSFGLLEVVQGLVVVNFVRLLATTFILRAKSGINLISMAKVLVRSALVTLVSTVPFWPIFYYNKELNEFEFVVVHSMFVSLFWLVGIVSFRHPVSSNLFGIILDVKRKIMRASR